MLTTHTLSSCGVRHQNAHTQTYPGGQGRGDRRNNSERFDRRGDDLLGWGRVQTGEDELPPPRRGLHINGHDKSTERRLPNRKNPKHHQHHKDDKFRPRRTLDEKKEADNVNEEGPKADPAVGSLCLRYTLVKFTSSGSDETWFLAFILLTVEP